MPKQRACSTSFDPNLCPLLKGLSPEEQQKRMAEDPLIRACMAHVDGGEDMAAACRSMGPDVVHDAIRTRKRDKLPV